MTNFTSNETILSILDNIPKGKRYSDVEDALGNQYVDLVQEGGGVLFFSLEGNTCHFHRAYQILKYSFLPLFELENGS